MWLPNQRDSSPRQSSTTRYFKLKVSSNFQAIKIDGTAIHDDHTTRQCSMLEAQPQALAFRWLIVQLNMIVQPDIGRQPLVLIDNTVTAQHDCPLYMIVCYWTSLQYQEHFWCCWQFFLLLFTIFSKLLSSWQWHRTGCSRYLIWTLQVHRCGVTWDSVPKQ